MKSAFNFAVVNAGQRNVEVHSELVATSTNGGFRLTGPACKALGIKPTDYAMFLHDEESGAWAVCKGFALRNGDSSYQTCKPRDAKAIVANQFDDLYEKALASGNQEFIDALTRNGISKDEQIEIIADSLTTTKYQGSKTASPSKMTGVGATVTFTDSNVWNQLKKDLAEPDSVCRVFSMNEDEVVDVDVFDGYATVTVKALVLGDYKDETPARRGEDESAE